MVKINILTYPNPILTALAKKVTSFGVQFQQLVDDLMRVKDFNNGLGLAAPQIGQSLKVTIIGYEPKKENEEGLKVPHLVLVNPKIIREEDGKEVLREGCLSLPGLEVKVPRFRNVTVLAQNRHGKKIKLKATGFFARVVQHEVDHLNGILILERASKDKEGRKVIKNYLKDLK